MRTDRQTEVAKAVSPDILSASVAVASHVRCTGDGDGFVLLDLEKGLYHSIDGVSARIWSGLLAGASPKQTATEIAQLCNVPFDRVGRDVVRFIQSLHAKGLVTIDG
jgi:coenzyme PQQ synthesis protein D (PqqD)